MGDEPESPLTSDGSEVTDEARPSVEPLRAASRRRGLGRLLRLASWRVQIPPSLTRAIAATILGALLLAILLAALRGLAGTRFPPRSVAGPSGPATTASAGTRTAPTPVPTVPWGEEWVPGGPSEAQRIVFAPSAPATAYTCGAPGLTSLAQPTPILLEMSADGGRTWQPISSPATG